MNGRHAFVCGTLVTVLLASAALAAETKPVLKGKLGEQTVTVTAVVEAIDVAKRMVTVKGPGGNSETFEVDESVKNLPQLKVGDTVKIQYYESLAWELHKAGTKEAGVEMTGGVRTAEPGKKPGGVAKGQATLTATVVAIDKAAQTFTLKGPEGNVRTFRARDPKNLEKASVGDLVQITYTEALAVSVEEAKKK